MSEANYQNIESGAKPIYAWIDGVPLGERARQQLVNIAQMPFVHHHVAVMPDVHWGLGATVGSVIPTKEVIIPAAVGVDIGCGMMAARLDGIDASDLPESLREIRVDIEAAVPVGFGMHEAPLRPLSDGDEKFIKWLEEKHPRIAKRRKIPLLEAAARQTGTLGGGNHFLEICLDECDKVWVMLHSGSRGIGNVIGMWFIRKAKKDMGKHHVRNLPDQDLAYLSEGTDLFGDYVKAVGWAQNYAYMNRQAMMAETLKVLGRHLPPFTAMEKVVNCHHNYVEQEEHYGANVYVTRKGAVRAREGDLGIIPGSMGARSYIVRGKGSEASFHSCSHGAGRAMSRRDAKRQFTVDDHREATEGVECRKDYGVLDETPGAYKDIDAVMAAQSDLVDIVHTLRQVVCIKG